jgi:hypothetical protein
MTASMYPFRYPYIHIDLNIITKYYCMTLNLTGRNIVEKVMAGAFC